MRYEVGSLEFGGNDSRFKILDSRFKTAEQTEGERKTEVGETEARIQKQERLIDYRLLGCRKSERRCTAEAQRPQRRKFFMFR